MSLRNHAPRLARIAAVVAALVAPLGPAFAEGWPERTTPEFDALLAAGRAEGEVVLFGDPLLAEEFSRAFERDSGIRVVFMSGTQNDKKIRFLRETEAQAATFDAFFGAYEALDPAQAGHLLPVAPSLLLPEITEGAYWREGRLHFLDTAATYVPVPVQYVSGLMLINSDIVDVAELRSWQDLLAPEFKGRIISHDPRVTGAGEGLVIYLAHVLGLEYFQQLFLGQEVRMTTDYRQITDAVARGTAAVGLGAHFRDIVRYQREGLQNLRVVVPEDAHGYLVGGGAALAIPSSAPHPNAAMVFANWYLSQHGQKAYTDIYALPSDRVDVVAGPWPEFIVPEPGETYLNQFTAVWVGEIVAQLRPKFLAMLPR